MVISASPSLLSSPPLFLFLFLPPDLSLCLSRASQWLSSLLLVLPCPPRARETLFTISLSSSAHSPQPPSHPPRSLTHSLARSVRHTRHGISPIPSFPPRFFLHCISSPRSTLFSPLSFSPPSISLSRGCSLIYSHPTLSRTSTFAPLFPFSLFSVASG